MPLIGAQGPGSNISWRGNLDEYPNFFGFADNLDVSPGIAITSNSQTITGINYKALVTAVGSGCSVSINGGQYVDGNDLNNPIIIRNSDSVQLQIRTQENGDGFDYNRSYNVDVKIGKRDASWLVRTKELDDSPIPFFFDDSLNNEVGISRTSNEVQVLDIDGTIGVDSLITTSTGALYINGVNVGSSGKVFNEDYIYLENTSSGFYNTNLPTTITLGSYTTSYNIRTRVADSIVDPFSFTQLINVDINSTHISNTITLSGVDSNINGNNLLPTSISGGEFRVIRNGVNLRDFSSDSFNTQNGDQIIIRIVASQNYLTKQTATLNVNGVLGSFEATTRPTPIKTFPSPFNFLDKTGVERTSTLTPPENRIDSDPITLTGMTTGANDFGTASITGLGGDGSRAQFKVVRGGQTIRDFGIDNFQVKNGDQIFLRIISSPNSLGTVQTTFTVSGTDTNVNLNGNPGSTSDTWNVTSAQRFCNITSFSLQEQTNAIPGQTYSRSFVASGFDKDCGCVVTTSDTSNSYLKIGNRTGTSLTVSLGETVEIFMISPYYDSTRSTTVILSSAFGTVRQSVYRIVPIAPPLPELILDANPRNSPFIFPDGGSTTLTYTYDYVTNASVTTNFGVTTISTPKGSGSRSITNILTTTTYTMTVSNSTGSTTKSVQVTVGDPPTPTVSLCPSNTSSCSNTSVIPYGSNITFFWNSSFATQITSTDFNTNNTQNGSITINNLTQDNRVYQITATGPGGTATATHTIDLTPSLTISPDNANIVNGQSTTLRWNSNLATTVVSSSGFNAGGQISGSVVVSPTITTTYGITVRDDQGNQISATTRINVTDDVTVNSFSFNPSSFSNQQLGSNVVSEPSFSGSGSVVGGLSPGISVNAIVSGTGAQFESGGTSKTVQNGTPTSSLRVRLTNSSSFGQQRAATLNINGVTASFTSQTLSCTVQNSSGTVDNAITISTRNSSNYGAYLATGLSGGSAVIPRTASQGGAEEFGPGSHVRTLPAGTNRIYAAVIGGGGGGGRRNSCNGSGTNGGGGGGAGWGAVTGNYSGVRLDITVGSGGPGATSQGNGANGGDTTVSINGGVVWRGSGGQGGGPSLRGNGGTNNAGPAGTSAGGTSGLAEGPRSSGGGGAGFVFGGVGQTGGKCETISSGGGGGGGNIRGGAGSPRTNPICGLVVKNFCNSLQGSSGANFGGGGGGGFAFTGGSGAQGRAYIEYQVSLSTETYFNLCREIMRAYWDKLNRPPTVSEIQTWVNNFKNNPGSYPNAQSIYNAIQGSRGATPVDNCGNTIPRFP